MQASQEVTIVVFLSACMSTFWYGIKEYDEEELQTVCHEDLLGIFEYYVIVWYSPARGVIFQSLNFFVSIHM